MKVLFCGPRDWSTRWVVRQEMDRLPVDTIIVHGDAAGADTHADFEARRRGFIVRSYPADWATYGRPAGNKRNQQMLDAEHPDAQGVHIDLCVALCYDPEKLTKGTGDMVRKALGTGLVVRLVSRDGKATVLGPIKPLPPEPVEVEPKSAWAMFDDE